MQTTIHRACQLRCEHLDNPLGLDETKPRLSWQLDDPRQGARQTAYQLAAASTSGQLETKPDLWDSRQIASDQCLDVVYGG